jgi:hypothetical protein
MKSRIILAKRKFTVEEYKGGDKAPKFDFTELIKVMKDWAKQ